METTVTPAQALIERFEQFIIDDPHRPRTKYYNSPQMSKIREMGREALSDLAEYLAALSGRDELVPAVQREIWTIFKWLLADLARDHGIGNVPKTDNIYDWVDWAKENKN